MGGNFGAKRAVSPLGSPVAARAQPGTYLLSLSPEKGGYDAQKAAIDAQDQGSSPFEAPSRPDRSPNRPEWNVRGFTIRFLAVYLEHFGFR